MDLLSLDTWLLPPHNRLSLHQVHRLVPVATIARGNRAARALTPADSSHEAELSSVALAPGREATLLEFLEMTNTDAFIVLRGDQVLYERYFGDYTRESRHIVMSVSKSLCGMLAGILVEDGLLDLDARTSMYVPELENGSYGGSTVGQLLDMTAVPDFDMTYTNPLAEVQAGDRSAGWRPRRDDDADGTRAFLERLQGSGGHGSAFQYCSATTDVLAWVLERAAHMPYARLLETKLWQNLGAEDDAVITVDNHGTPYACAGISMRLRDLARFGRLILDGGRIDGRQIIPREWISTTAGGGDFDTSDDTDPTPGTYRNQWWVPGGSHGSFYAAGIFGQYLWLDPSTGITIAKFSSEGDPLSHGSEHRNALQSIASNSAGWSGTGDRSEGKDK
ncbi:serine hydrolase [Arthrobacter sp. UYEF20]|uniref:serine hydrolase domain-containing protein n=1 Tax=Arthrobacter sp. UYEF20 TaxID=1756363 RepID=UPI003393D498